MILMLLALDSESYTIFSVNFVILLQIFQSQIIMIIIHH